MTFFRVQNKQGNGPYKGCNESLQFLHHHNNSKLHPMPLHDEGIDRFIEPDEICAFESPEQLKQWFTDKELKTLKEEWGFEVVSVSGTLRAKGKYQVLITPDIISN